MKYFFFFIIVILFTNLNLFAQKSELIQKWEIDSVQNISNNITNRELIKFVDFCNNDENILVATEYRILLISVLNGNLVKEYQFPNVKGLNELDTNVRIYSIAISNNSTEFAVLNNNGDFFIYNVDEKNFRSSTQNFIHFYRDFVEPKSFAFSPNDDKIIFTIDDAKIDNPNFCGLIEYNLSKKLFERKFTYSPISISFLSELYNVNDSLLLTKICTYQFIGGDYGWYTGWSLFNLNTFNFHKFIFKKYNNSYSTGNNILKFSSNFEYLIHDNCTNAFFFQGVSDTNFYFVDKSKTGFFPHDAVFSQDSKYLLLHQMKYPESYVTIRQTNNFQQLLESDQFYFFSESLFSKLSSKYILNYKSQKIKLFEFNPVSVQEKQEFLFSFFPNPASDKLTISQIPDGAVSYEIFDLFGIRVLPIEAIHVLPLQIDVSRLSSGVYFLKMNNQPPVKFIKL